MLSGSFPRQILPFVLPIAWSTFGIAAATAANVAGPIEELPTEVASILAAYGMPARTFSVFVQDTAEDTPLLVINPDIARNPASTIKLLTTFIALDELDPSFRWESEIYLGGPLRDGRLDGDLYLKGHGDPYMVIERYWLLLDQLRQKGLREIGGDLVIDNTYFDVPMVDPGAFDGQASRAYNVNPDAFLVNFQTVGFTFRPDPESNGVSIVAVPNLANLEISNRLGLSDRRCGGYQNGIAIALGGPGSERVTFSGKMGRFCAEYRTSRAVLQGPTYAYGLFRSLWTGAGASLKGELRVDAVPEDLEPFHTFESLALGDIIRLINKWSNNVMARHLLLTLGAERFGAPATVANGRQAVIELLHERGLDFPELRLDNGAGLSRETRISAASLGRLLLTASDSIFRAEFVSSLPLSGLDGTLRRRFRDEGLAGRMHIKTGRLDDVFAMAGYVRSQSGREFVVVAIQNETGAHRGPGEEAQSALLKWVYRQ